MPIDTNLPVENQIVQWFVLGIRSMPDLDGKANPFNETNCYPAVIPTEVEGADNQYIQVCPEALAKYNAGDGYQMGGNLMRLMYVRCAYFFQFNADEHQRADQAMVQAVNGVLSLIDSLRARFQATNFGGLLCEVVRYETTSATSLINPDHHLFRRDIVFSAPFLTPIHKEVQSLVPADIANIGL